MGFFDAIKGMFGDKTDAPVNNDNASNVTAGVNPMIPSSQPSVPLEEEAISNVNPADSQSDLVPPQPTVAPAPPNSLEPDNVSESVPSGGITASPAPENTTNTETASPSNPSLSSNSPEQSNPDLDSGDLSDESTNSPLPTLQATPSEPATPPETVINNTGGVTSEAETPDNTSPSASLTPDATSENSEPDPGTESLNGPDHTDSSHSA